MTMDFTPLGPDAPLYAIKANLFKALAHPVRIRVLEVLAEHGSVTMSALVTETAFDEDTLVPQLAVLRRHGAAVAERRDEDVTYRIAHPRIGELLQVAKAFLNDTASRATPPERPRLRSVPDRQD